MQGAVVGLLIVNTALLFLTLCGVIGGMVVLLDRTKHLSNIFPILATLIQFLNGEMGDPSMSGPGPIFRSLDGKYTASSLEELISKMQADPNSGITSADIEQLRNMFNGLTDDMDDDDDDLEDWQKKKDK